MKRFTLPLRHPGPSDGGTPPAAPTPPASNPPVLSNRAVKESMVKVRATGQPVNLDGIHIGNGKNDVAEVPESALKRLGGMVTRVACIAALLLLGSMAAYADQYDVAYLTCTNGNGTNTFLNGGTNQVKASITNSYNTVLPGSPLYNELAVQLTGKMDASAGGQVQAFLDWSGDGTNWVSAPFSPLNLTINGTTQVTVVSNITTGAIGYVRLSGIGNTNATAVNFTNFSFEVIKKPLRKGVNSQ